MNYDVCPVCGMKNTLKKTMDTFTGRYGQTTVNTEVPVLICSNCGSGFDIGKESDSLIKKAINDARNKSVKDNLLKLEKEYSFSQLENDLYLPPKTLSKWKTGIKAPSAAAATLVNLLGVFPWLTYVCRASYEPTMAYKIAGAAFFNKATKDEKVKAFFSSTDNYEIIGLAHNKTLGKKEVGSQKLPKVTMGYESIESTKASTLGVM